MTRRMWTIYLWLAMASLPVKLLVAFYFYEYGYLAGDRSLINPDAFAYADQARLGGVEIQPGAHWLYDYLNRLIYTIAPNYIPVYLVMTLFNVSLSMLLPLAMWPLSQALKLDAHEKEPYFTGLCALTLFWPSAIWVCTENLKDTLLALLVAVFISCFVLAANPDPSSPARRCAAAFAGLCDLYLVFSLRSYVGALLLVAAFTYILLKDKRWGVKICAVVVLAAIAASPAGHVIIAFSNLHNNFIINPEAQLDVNRNYESIGQTELVNVNRSPAALIVSLPKTLINPYPSIQMQNVAVALVMLKSVFMCLTLLFFFVSLWRWKGSLKWFLCLCLFLPWAFYWIVPTYSGPRQLFSSGIDGLYVCLLPLFWLRYRRQTSFGASLALGSLLVNGLVFLTAKALF